MRKYHEKSVSPLRAMLDLSGDNGLQILWNFAKKVRKIAIEQRSIRMANPLSAYIKR